MKAAKYGLTAAVLICSLIWSQNTVSARVYFRISIGSPDICAYPDYWWDSYPYYSWHRGCYRWLDRDGYRWLDRHRYRGPYILGWRDYYWRRPLCSSGLSISSGRLWFGVSDYYPGVLDLSSYSTRHIDPIVQKVPKLIAGRQPVVKPEDDGKTVEYFIQLRRKKGELIERLRKGHKEEREEAIVELARYSLDTRVRKALEEVLQTDPDCQLRRQAAKSLSRLRNRKALSALEKAKIQDPDNEVRMEADKAIRKIEGH